MLGSDGAKTLLAALDIAAGVTVIACALAIADAPWAPRWWRPLVIAGGLLGLAAFVVFIDGQLGLLVEEGGVGAVISVVLVGSATALDGASRAVKTPGASTPTPRASAGRDPR